LIFSIIIPTYNRAEQISKAIKSCLGQSYSNFELIIVDDGSTDSTEKTIFSFKDSRIKYFKKENAERGAARNFGISKAKGAYITFLDSDDILYSNHLSHAFSVIKSRKEIQLFHQAYEMVNEKGEILFKMNTINENANKIIIKGNVFSCIGVFISSNIIDDIKFSEDRKFSGTEDWLLWLKLAAKYKIKAFNTITAKMIHHKNRSVLSFDQDLYDYRTKYLVKSLLDDEFFIKNFGVKSVIKIKAHMLSYSSLHAALNKKKKYAIKYIFKSLFTSINELFTRRFLAIIKLLIIK
tara:strand:+ start:142 stop:1023 length:882 start_codon:yes stop_codon:yes gene_type:complete